jgi:hypothetical protein
MTRKQWINHLTDEEALKIHRTFRQVDKGLFALPLVQPISREERLFGHRTVVDEFTQQRRSAVRAFLRKNKLTQRDLNVQYGRLAAGMAINLKLHERGNIMYQGKQIGRFKSIIDAETTVKQIQDWANQNK